MGKSKKNNQEGKPQPAMNREQIQQKLEEALAELKPSLGEKKFRRRIKKAGKLFSSGLNKKTKAPRVKLPKAAPDTPVSTS